MWAVSKIIQQLEGKIKMILSLGFVLFLTACHESCETFQEFLNNGLSTAGTDPVFGNCFFCPVFKTLTDSGANAADKSWELLPDLFIPVVGLVMALYVAILVLKNVGSFSKQSVTDFLTDNKKGVMVLGFKTAVVIALLSNTFIINSVLSPLIVSSGEVGITLAAVDPIELNLEQMMAPVRNIKGDSPWKPAFELVYNVAKGFNDAAYKLTAMGNSLNCNATIDSIFSWKWLMLVYGNIYVIFGWLAAVGVCFYLVNMILNFTIAAVLLPLGIAFAVSEKTMSYTKNIWGIFLNTFCNFMMMGIVIGMSLQMINMSMGKSVEADGTDATLTSQKMDVEQMLNANQIEALSDMLWENGSLILTIVMLSIIVKLVQQINSLAKALSEASGVTSAGSQAMAPIQKAIGRKAGKMFSGVGKSVEHGLKTASKNASTVLKYWGKGIGKGANYTYKKTGLKKVVNAAAGATARGANYAYTKTGLNKAVNTTVNVAQKAYTKTGLNKAVNTTVNAAQTGANIVRNTPQNIRSGINRFEQGVNRRVTNVRNKWSNKAANARNILKALFKGDGGNP